MGGNLIGQLLKTIAITTLVASATLSFAGHYAITITGGNLHYIDGSVGYDLPYDSYSLTVNTAKCRGGDEPFTDPFETSSHCSGVVTAQCDWIGSDSPPETIVVREFIGAYSGFPNQLAGSKQATTGIQGEQIITQDGDDIYPSVIAAKVNRYSVKHNASHFTLTCSPEASASIPVGTYDEDFGVHSNISYDIDISAVNIIVTGGKNNVGEFFLVGQRLTAQVSPVLGLISAASGTTPACQWIVTGAEPFKEFHVELLSGTSLYSTGKKILLSNNDLQAANLKCCFAKTGSVVVECSSAHFSVPAGSVPAVGLDITVPSTEVRIQSPENIQPAAVALGTVELSQPTTTPTPLEGRLTLFGNNGTTGVRTHGINYRSAITTPSDYWQTYQYGNYPATDKGGFRWVQILQGGTTRTLDDLTVQTERCGPGTFSPNDLVPWTLGLDSIYPYEPTSISSNTAYPNPRDPYGEMYIANFTVGDMSLNEAGDTPGTPLSVTDNETGTHNATSYHVRDDFIVYQLYRPPGEGSQFVPIQSFHWWWGGDVSTTPDRGAEPKPGITWYSTARFSHNYDNLTNMSNVSFIDWDHLMSAPAIKFWNN